MSLDSDNSNYQALFSTLIWVMKDDLAVEEFIAVLTKFSAKYYVMSKMAEDLEALRTNVKIRQQISRHLDDLLADKEL